MDDLNKRVVALEKENKQLMKVVEQLVRRLQQVEKQARTAYHAARENEMKVNQINYALRETARRQRREE